MLYRLFILCIFLMTFICSCSKSNCHFNTSRCIVSVSEDEKIISVLINQNKTEIITIELKAHSRNTDNINLCNPDTNIYRVNYVNSEFERNKPYYITITSGSASDANHVYDEKTYSIKLTEVNWQLEDIKGVLITL